MNFPTLPARFLTMGSAACGLIFPSFAADTVLFQSGETQATMVELFTSQGCSSCPPAEAWLNRFADDPQLWKTIVPVAFHVDYWDNLGWKDPFASRKNTERQYRYTAEGRARSVYTPCFVVNGREWHEWFDREPLPKEGRENAGVLSAVLEGASLRVSFPKGTDRLDLNVAILGAGTETNVARGENRGRQLKSNFVALQQLAATSEDGAWSLDLPNSVGEAERYAIALWVTRTGDLEPIQATGGWLPSGVFE